MSKPTFEKIKIYLDEYDAANSEYELAILHCMDLEHFASKVNQQRAQLLDAIKTYGGE